MQDRFKFRVWNKLSNTMTYNFMFGNFMQKSLEDYEKKDWVGLNYEPDYICFNNKGIEDNLVIMQCTGLKDKNGKLIYEGDIVRDKHSEAVATIEYLPYAFNLMAHIRGMDDYLPLEDICYALEVATPFEVIGNIYENPELLEG